MVEFNQTIYHGREASGVVKVTLNLLGGTASVNLNVTVSTLPVTATGSCTYVKHMPCLCNCNLNYG